MSGGPDKIDALVVGGGPAGLMAAEVLADAGRRVVVAEAMPSAGRKLLMAGKSGLNLTKDEAAAAFQARILGGNVAFRDALAGFGPVEVRDWAEGLGQEVFTGSTGRVFPVAMKASPLLRAWLRRLAGLGVGLRTQWRWTGWDGADWVFGTPEVVRRIAPGVAVMALGGASWPRLGSDGGWVEVFRGAGVPVAPLVPANMGLRIGWSAHMSAHFGRPVKGVRLVAGDRESRGEFVITAAGIEGGGVYEVSHAVREGAALALDLAPDLGAEAVAARLARPRGKASLGNHLRKALGLSPAARALLTEWGRPLPEGAALAARVKAMAVPVAGVMPLAGAISTAGGVAREALDGLMLRARPGTFVAGEMLDWEAPTGGYLLTACLASGRAAGQAAAEWEG